MKLGTIKNYNYLKRSYLDEVDTLDDVDIDDDVDTELEVDTLKIQENFFFSSKQVMIITLIK